MSKTSSSLIDRLREPSNETAWERMVDVYTPLIRGWLKRYAVQDQDVEDLLQEVLAIVVRKMPEFRQQPQIGAFRRWLRNITVNCLRDFWRAQKYRPRASGADEFAHMLDQLADGDSSMSKLWDREHDDHVARHLLEMVRGRFEDKTWRAFQGVTLAGTPVDQVAQELGMSVNAVFIAKSRVMHALRKAGAGLID
jgi:RNA polymerase sigma-70 factor (ECF subfamily)